MKKLISTLIITTILFTTFCTAESGDLTYEDGYRDGANAGYNEGYSDGIGAGVERVPIVNFIEKKEIPEVGAGEILDITIEFENDSKYSARDLIITPIFEDTPLVYERPITYKTTQTLRSNKEDKTSFKIKVSEDAKIGTYPLKFKLEYKNNREELFSREEITYFKVTSEKLKPILTISNIKNNLEKIKAGDIFELSFDLKNIGGSMAKNVELSLDGFNQDSLIPVDSNDYKYIGTIDSNQLISPSFSILASEEITSKNNMLTVNVKYLNHLDEEQTLTKDIYIMGVDIGDNVSKEDEEKSARPKMIISSYGLDPMEVVAGDIFTFNFTFKNTSKDKKIRNLKITISSDDGAFIITRGSNTFYIEEMERGSVLTRSIELKAKQDLASNSYKVNVAFDYEDFNGNEYSAIETLNIPVTEYSKLVINSVYAGEGYVNGNTNLSFDYVNMGKATVSNLTASVEGDYTSVQSINYIGNLAAGTSDYFDIEVTPTKEGINYGTLVLSFEDSSGGIIEVRKEFEGNAFAEDFFEPDVPVGPIDMPLEPIEVEKDIPTWQIILCGLGSFLIMFIITKMITTKVIRKRLEDEL